MQTNSNTATGELKWNRSDNSFSFNFLLEPTPSGTHNTEAPAKAESSAGEKSDSASGFTFNFQIPPGSEGTPHSSELEVKGMEVENTEVLTSQSTEPTPNSSNTKSGKKKKKKKKKSALEVGEDEPQKTLNNSSKTTEGSPKQESIELTPEQQLSREMDWCIEQLELGLRTQKSSSKQREEAARALKTLRSSKAPVVKKRQVMRAVSGDYRRKMEEEKDRQFKLIHSAMTSARVTAVSEPSRKPMFCCRTASKVQTTTCVENAQDTHGPSHTVKSVEGEKESFVFTPSHEEFRFNFDL